MTRNWFRKGQTLVLAGRECVIENRLTSGDLQLRDAATSACFAKSYDDLVNALFDGQLVIPGEITGESHVERRAKALLTADFTQLPQAWREEAKRRHRYVTEIRRRNITARTPETLRPLISNVAKSINDMAPPSWRTLCRWYRRFVSSGENVRTLVPLVCNRGNKKRRVQPQVIEIIERVIDQEYLRPQRITVATVYETIVLRVADENRFRPPGMEKLKAPDRATVYREVAKLDPYEKMAARFGKRIADLKFKALKLGVRPTRPLERVEIDHTKLDLFVVDPDRGIPIGRPWLTSAIDVCSKSVVGFYMGFTPPSYLSVMQCLRHAVAPKSYVKARYPSVVNRWDAHGLPETVVVDNGKEFHSTHFEDACLQLGILVQYAPIKLAWYKGCVERYFGTLNRRLLHQQPGTTFSNIFDKGDYDPKANAIIPIHTLHEILHVWIVDDYHRREHRGLRGIPAVAWEEGIASYPPALPPRREELEVLLGMIEERVVSASGVEIHGLLYNDDGLALLRRGMGTGERVRVKYDPTDLSLIHVFDASQGAFIPVPAVDQKYTQNLTLYQHEVIKSFARGRIKEKVSVVDLALARQTVEEIVKRGWAETKKSATRQKMARFLSHGEIDSAKTLPEPAVAIEATPIVALDARQSRALVGHGNVAGMGVSSLTAGSSDVDGREDVRERSDSLPPARGAAGADDGAGAMEPTKEARVNKRRRAQAKRAKSAKLAAEAPGTGARPEGFPGNDDGLDTTGWDADFDLPTKEENA